MGVQPPLSRTSIYSGCGSVSYVRRHFRDISKERYKMKTHKFATTIVGGLVIALVQAAAFNVTAQVTRQESTNQLKKAVYTLDPSTTTQYIKQWIIYSFCDGNPYYMYLYYAMVPIPEITVSNMPSVQVWKISPGSQGWTPMPAVRVSDDWNWSMGPSFYVLTNGVCGVLWKTETHPQQFPQLGWQQTNFCPNLEFTNIFRNLEQHRCGLRNAEHFRSLQARCHHKPIGSFSYRAHDDEPNLRNRIHTCLASNKFVEHPRQQYYWNRRPSFGYGLQQCKAALLSCIGTMSEKSQIRMPPNKPAAANPAMTSQLHIGSHWRGVAEPER